MSHRTNAIVREAGNPPSPSDTTNEVEVRFDSTAGVLKVNNNGTVKSFVDTNTAQTLTNKTFTNPVVTNAPVDVTGTTLAVDPALHAGRTITLNRAAGIAVTLPAATGTGNVYKFVVGTTFTADATIKVASASDYMVGTALLFQDAGDTVVGFATANTGTASTETDTVDLFDTSNVTGGIKGAHVELTDIATAQWHVRYVSDAAGTEATPFKVTV